MQATLLLNLSDALDAEELETLTALAQRDGKTIERVLFEAAKSLVEKFKRPAGEGEVMSAGGASL